MRKARLAMNCCERGRPVNLAHVVHETESSRPQAGMGGVNTPAVYFVFASLKFTAADVSSHSNFMMPAFGPCFSNEIVN